jgi:hypothetical protein
LATTLPPVSRLVATLTQSSIRLREGELVVYLRTRSLKFQCRFKLADGTPDAFCPTLFGDEGAGVEVAAFADRAMSQDDQMRTVAARLMHAANRIKKGAVREPYWRLSPRRAMC